MYLKTCKKGEILFRQGDVEEWMYYIHQGKVGIFIAYGTENEQKVEELFSDQFVGDMGLLNGEPRSATAVALEDDTILMEIREENLKDYFLKEPEKLLLLMRNLSDRLRKINGKLADVCRKIYEAENA